MADIPRQSTTWQRPLCPPETTWGSPPSRTVIPSSRMEVFYSTVVPGEGLLSSLERYPLTCHGKIYFSIYRHATHIYMHSDIHNITTCHTHEHTHLQTNSKVTILGNTTDIRHERWRALEGLLPQVLSFRVFTSGSAPGEQWLLMRHPLSKQQTWWSFPVPLSRVVTSPTGTHDPTSLTF